MVGPSRTVPVRTAGTGATGEYEVGRVALVLFACVLGLTALGLLALRGVSVDAFDLLGRGENPVHAQHPGDPRLTVPAFFSAALLATAGGLALDRWHRSRRLVLVIAAVLFALLALGEVTALEERLRASPEISSAAVSLGFGAVGAAAALAALRDTAAVRRSRILIVGGGATWLVAALLEGLSRSETSLSLAAAEVLEMVAGSLWLLALLAAWRERADRRLDGPRSDAADPLARIDPRAIGVGLGLCVLALAALGALFRSEAVAVPAFDVNAERSLPTLFSGMLLLAAAGLAALHGAAEPARRGRLWWWALAGALAFLSFDEVASVHERLQFWTGSFGQLSLAPIVLVGGLAGLVIIRRLWWHRLAPALLVAGASMWLAAQAVDAAQSGGRLDSLSVPEEVLEMGGSVCFCLALLTALQAARRRPATSPGG